MLPSSAFMAIASSSCQIVSLEVTLYLPITWYQALHTCWISIIIFVVVLSIFRHYSTNDKYTRWIRKWNRQTILKLALTLYKIHLFVSFYRHPKKVTKWCLQASKCCEFGSVQLSKSVISLIILIDINIINPALTLPGPHLHLRIILSWPTDGHTIVWMVCRAWWGVLFCR